MKIQLQKSTWRYILIGCILVILAAFCVWCYPRHVYTFKYTYEIGKPWGYEQLIAEETIPLYKTDDMLAEEQATVLDMYTPYYQIEASIAKKQQARILQSPSANHLSRRTVDYLSQALQDVYTQGLLSADDYEHLTKTHQTKISIIDSAKVSTLVDVQNCYTPRSAYEYIFKKASVTAKRQLQDVELAKYLQPNLIYDAELSDKVRADLLATVAPTQGIVEEGAKIVDRGEIVSEETAQKLNSLRIARLNKQVDYTQYIWSLVGDITLVITFIGLLLLYLIVFRRSLLEQTKHVLFFSLLIGLMVGLAYLLREYTVLSIYLLPFAWVPILVRVFYDARTAFQMHLTTVLLVTFMIPNSFEFLLFQLITGLVVVSSMQEITSRGQLFRTSGLFALAAAFIYTIFTLAVTGDVEMINWRIFIYIAVNALLIMFAYGLIYFCEKVFGFISAITLVELTNANSNLLMDFAARAPGTFQHSMQVSDLATAAARKIGANVLLVRTGALYHDIGKMSAPHNFIENQNDGINPLSDLNSIEAAAVIIRHVEEGVRIAKKHNLPEIIIRFIQTHHGTSKTRYFYNQYINEHPGEVVDESLFTYPGPRPSMKETAILMMADAVEARSRSMKEFTEEGLADMVEQMVNTQIADGQFKDTILSFKDVEEVKTVFIEKLISMNHHRITYPEIQQETHNP